MVPPESHKRSKVAIPGVSEVILVASGKGGVGKSTVALQTALSLARMGYRVALADADVYGSSIPWLLGISSKVDVNEQGVIVPMESHGLKTISLGNFIMDNSKAVIWRGPMLTKAVHKLIAGTKWGEVDYLIVDTPPGTGDVHISLANMFVIGGAVIVTTPQELAVVNAMKTHDMLQILKIPVIGIVENMSYFADRSSGNRIHFFGKGGAQKIVKLTNSPLLGTITLDPQICESSERGDPTLLGKELLDAYDNIAVGMLRHMGVTVP